MCNDLESMRSADLHDCSRNVLAVSSSLQPKTILPPSGSQWHGYSMPWSLNYLITACLPRSLPGRSVPTWTNFPSNLAYYVSFTDMSHRSELSGQKPANLETSLAQYTKQTRVLDKPHSSNSKGGLQRGQSFRSVALGPRLAAQGVVRFFGIRHSSAWVVMQTIEDRNFPSGNLQAAGTRLLQFITS